MGEISALVGEIDGIVGGISGAEAAAKEAGAEQGAEAAAKEEGAEQGAEAAVKEEGGEQEAVDADDSGADWAPPAAEEGKANAAQEAEAEEAPEAQEGAGLANIRDGGAASSLARYPASWEAFRGKRVAGGFFRCGVCGAKKEK